VRKWRGCVSLEPTESVLTRAPAVRAALLLLLLLLLLCRYCGYDVVMFLKCLRLGFWTLAYSAPFVLLVILPYNLSHKGPEGEYYARGYFATTISNIDSEGDKGELTVHCIAMVMVNVIFMALLLNLHLDYIQLRRNNLKMNARDRTVFVTQIPVRLRSTLLLRKYFDVMYTGDVESVQFIKHINDLDKVVASREDTVMRLERSILLDTQRNMGKGKLEDVDSSETSELRSTLEQENKQVQKLQKEYMKVAVLEEKRAREKSTAVLTETFQLRESYVQGLGYEDAAEELGAAASFDSGAQSLNPLGRAAEERGRALAPEDLIEVNVRVMDAKSDQHFRVGLKKGSSIGDLKVRMGVAPDATAVINPGTHTAQQTSPSPAQASPHKGSPKKSPQKESRRRTQEELTEDSRTIASLMGEGGQITLIKSAQPAIMSLGNQPHSSRRQRLSISRTQEELATGADPYSSLQAQGVHKEKFPLTGALVDLAKEIHLSGIAQPRSDVPGTNSDKAFVTFRSVTSATISCQVSHSLPGHTHPIQVDEAPDVTQDIFWQNIHQGFAMKGPKSLLTGLVVFLLVAFFVFPVAYLSRIMGPNRMEELTTSLNWPWYLRSLAGSALPMTLIIITNLLPPLFTGLGFFEGSLTWSLNGLRQLDRMTIFILVNVFGVSIISGTIVEQIFDIVRNPTGSLVVIAGVLPTMSGFFTQYLMMKACVSLSVEILRGLTVFHMLVRFLFQCKDATKRERLLGTRTNDFPMKKPSGSVASSLGPCVCTLFCAQSLLGFGGSTTPGGCHLGSTWPTSC